MPRKSRPNQNSNSVPAAAKSLDPINVECGLSAPATKEVTATLPLINTELAMLMEKIREMEQWQIATQEKLKFAEEKAMALQSSSSTNEPPDDLNDFVAVSSKSQALFEDTSRSFARDKLLLGKCMRRSLLKQPHFKGVDNRVHHFHVFVEKGTRFPIVDHISILVVLMHAVQAEKMTIRNTSPNVKLI